MGPESRYDELIADLRHLADPVPVPPVGTELVDAVMARLSDVPAPAVPSPARRLRQQVVDAVSHRRRQVLIAVLVLLLGGLGVAPVRATVADWFGFDGVQVHLDPTRPPSTATPSPPPTVAGSLPLDQARKLVSFDLVTLPALGPAQGVDVSPDRRMLSMSWTGSARTEHAPARLDQFGGQLDYLFAKTASHVQFTMVGTDDALWFGDPHDVVILDAAGHRRTETARLAGHTLIWQHDGTVLRLEGDFTLEQAVAIAQSQTSPTPAP